MSVASRSYFLIAAIGACCTLSVEAVKLRGYLADKYMIGTFPSLRQVQYVKLPDKVWRPLIAEGLQNPEAIVVDQKGKRIFVADTHNNSIYSYSFQVDTDGSLSTGERVGVVDSVFARGLALDGAGNLFIAGHRVVQSPETPEEAILKQSVVGISVRDIDTSELPVPKSTWIRSLSESSTISGGASKAPLLFAASSLAVDPMHVYWVNSKEGFTSGSVIEASLEPGRVPEQELRPLATNVEEVLCVALAASSVFYGAKGGIFGVPRSGSTSECMGSTTAPASSAGGPSESPVLEACRPIAAAAYPTGMVWDGDSLLYVADAGDGTVLTLPTGSLAPHATTKVMDAQGIRGIGILQVVSAAGHVLRCRWQVWLVLAAATVQGTNI